MSASHTEPKTRRLVAFTRYPVPGRAKTRLIPALGSEGAAELHARMTEHTLRSVRPSCAALGAVLEVRFDGGTEALMESWLGRDLLLNPQREGGLGERMSRAIARAFHDGTDDVVIIGCDCPDLSGEIIAGAFDALDDHDVVFGPAIDGGYYLVGISSDVPESSWRSLFQEIDWGTARVLEQSLDRAAREEIRVVLLEPLADVDTPEDLDITYTRWHETNVL